MRFKALFYRALFALAGFVLPLAVLAAATPYVINAEPFKKHLIADLKKWTGARLQLKGPVAIESFFSLSLNAQDIEFYEFKSVPQLKTLKAERIVARVDWMDLFAGQLVFDKIKIENAQIEMRSFDRDDVLKVAETLLGMSRNAQFDAFVVRDSVVSFIGADGNESERRLDNLLVTLDPDNHDIEVEASLFADMDHIDLRANIEAGSLQEAGAVLPLELSIQGEDATASFEGAANIESDWRVLGRLSIAMAAPSRIGRWVNEPYLAGVNMPVSVSANANISRDRVILDDARFSVAGQDASGELDFVSNGSNRKLAGTLAFGAFAAREFAGDNAQDENLPAIDPGLLSTILTSVDMDLRLSAESIRLGRFRTDAAAFTVLGKKGRVSTEVAHVALFGGSVFGHAEFDLTSDVPHIRTRLTVDNLDISEVQSVAGITPRLSGALAGNIEASTHGSAIGDWLDNATLSGRAGVPARGRLRLDLERLASLQPSAEQHGWDGIDGAWSDFDDLRFTFAYEPGHSTFSNVVIKKGGNVIKADGKVDMQDINLDLRFDFLPPISAGATGDLQNQSATTVTIQGPFAAPVLHCVSAPNKAANDTRGISQALERTDRL
ncbi:MAG: hypothetical protein KTR19_00265 [Hyphomicrobiales bacterium]|nr:hypothetical protein [Hyphomicrobiales bacterium]